MANSMAYIIGAAALGVTAVWIAGQKAEPASARVPRRYLRATVNNRTALSTGAATHMPA
jgi:FMN phosphatase YigB (HAD superfamily)